MRTVDGHEVDALSDGGPIDDDAEIEVVGVQGTAIASPIGTGMGGTGSITVNDKPIEQYFGRATDAQNVAAPLKLAGAEQRFDVTVKVSGGGDTGHVRAVKVIVQRLGVVILEIPAVYIVHVPVVVVI